MLLPARKLWMAILLGFAQPGAVFDPVTEMKDRQADFLA
jgi:hypothetical protein